MQGCCQGVPIIRMPALVHDLAKVNRTSTREMRIWNRNAKLKNRLPL